MKKLWIFLLLFIAFIGGVIFINQNLQEPNIENEIEKTGKVQVVASFYPLYFFASEIGGDKALVVNLTSAGTDPHSFEPKAREIAEIKESDLLIINGAGFEPWYEKIEPELRENDIATIISSQGLDLLEGIEDDDHDVGDGLEEDGDEEHVFDPHVWLSPSLARRIVREITNGFIGIDSMNENYYIENENMLISKLDTLDQNYKEGLSKCRSRDIITSHMAFTYLANDYGLNQVSISGLSHDEEPSSKTLADIALFAKANNVKYIFFESLASPKLADTIAREVGASTLVLDPIEGLSDDDIEAGKNYFTIMEDNLKNLQTALQCVN